MQKNPFPATQDRKRGKNVGALGLQTNKTPYYGTTLINLLQVHYRHYRPQL